MKNKLILAILMLSSLLSGVCLAGFDEGLNAAQQGDYATALKEWEPLAEKGGYDSMLNLGVMYEFGHGVPQNYVIAHLLYRRAATYFSIGCTFSNLGASSSELTKCTKSKAAKYQGELELELSQTEIETSTILLNKIETSAYGSNLLTVIDQYIRHPK